MYASIYSDSSCHLINQLQYRGERKRVLQPCLTCDKTRTHTAHSIRITVLRRGSIARSSDVCSESACYDVDGMELSVKEVQKT